MKKIEIFDTTLRDGAQGEGISFSVNDKIKIAKALDDFFVDYIEIGFPASNPKDAEFCDKMKSIKLKHSKLAAFGSTIKPTDDVHSCESMKKLLNAETPTVVIYGKSSSEYVRDVLRITEEENLGIIRRSVEYLKSNDREVIFDAEHFYFAYQTDREYAYKVLDCALNAGADVLCLCDTRGDVTPDKAYEITETVIRKYNSTRIAVHFHDDIGCAAANSLLAAKAGAVQIQGTFLGFGERCGNADLSKIIPSLKFKYGYEFCADMKNLRNTANRIAEISNVRIRNNNPYIGKSAFYHKAGAHIDAVKKIPSSFEHIDPALVGNEHKFLLSEISGRTTLLEHVRSIVPEANKESEELTQVVSAIKEQEYYGYHYEAAEASLQLLIRRVLYKYNPHFKVLLYKSTDDFPSANGQLTSMAMVQVEVNGKTETAASLGNGPVNALDCSMRRAISVFYPEIADIRLTDFKVRVIDNTTSTAAKVRVLIETTDGVENWTTVGVSFDIIEACLTALIDSFEYKLLKSDKST